MARVQPLVEALDHGTLARPVHAGHQDQDGELPLLRELQLRLQQLRPSFGSSALKLALSSRCSRNADWYNPSSRFYTRPP